MSDDTRFDRELARAARSLVTEQLPLGVLDLGLATDGRASGAVRARRPVPLFAGVGVALVVLLLTAVALVPGGGLAPASPSPTPSPSPSSPPAASPSPSLAASGAFRSTVDMRADYLRLHYACVAGSPVPSIGPGPDAVVREGVICTAPADAGPYISAVIVGEAADGRAVDVHVKADLTEADTTQARYAIAEPLAKAAAIAASGQTIGNQLAQWVLATAPTIEPSKGAGTDLLGFSLKIVRNASGGYELLVHPI